MIYTLDEILDLRNVVIGEASNEVFEGKVAIVEVILNRVKDSQSRWPKTITEVIHQPLQFSCFNNNDPNPARILSIAIGAPISLVCMSAVMTGLIGSNWTHGANHYHTIQRPKNVEKWPPMWIEKMIKTAEIGNHVFWRA